MQLLALALLFHLAYAQAGNGTMTRGGQRVDGQIEIRSTFTTRVAAPTSTPSTSPDKGNFLISVAQTSSTSTTFNVADSLSDQAAGVPIPYTSQSSVCTITSDTKERIPVACSQGAWEIFYSGTTATIRHYVIYKNAYIIRGGYTVLSDGHQSARREASQIPVFGGATVDAPGASRKSYTLDQWAPGNLRPASGVPFDFIDGTGGLII